MKDIFFHVGLHRTGTTFLQRKVFPNIKEIALFGQGNEKWNLNKEISENRITLISDENISCGGVSFKENEHNAKKKRRKLAKEIKKRYPDAKIIITIREKESWIKSMYAEYVKKGGSKTYDYWYTNILEQETLQFNEYIDFLQNLFEEVLICRFEDFKKNPDEFIQRICDFIGVEVPTYDPKPIGVRLTKNRLELLRLYNILFKTKFIEEGILPEWMNPLNWYYRLDK